MRLAVANQGQPVHQCQLARFIQRPVAQCQDLFQTLANGAEVGLRLAQLIELEAVGLGPMQMKYQALERASGWGYPPGAYPAALRRGPAR